jgi:maltooligosyltrehalose trehalohydrolase
MERRCHNAAHVLATGRDGRLLRCLRPRPLGADIARALAEGFAHQGPERGEPSGHLPPAAFVDFLQNHDQTGNRALGERLVTLTDPATHDALTAILLLSPHVPLMFMGEDWGEVRPFLFFAGFGGELAEAVTEGRRREFADFPAFAGHTGDVPDPIDPATFEASRSTGRGGRRPEGAARARRSASPRASGGADRAASRRAPERTRAG